MKYGKAILISFTIILTSLVLSACENTHVSGSVSYGMSMGPGYPMYYGAGYHRSPVVVVRPPRGGGHRPPPPRPRRR